MIPKYYLIVFIVLTLAGTKMNEYDEIKHERQASSFQWTIENFPQIKNNVNIYKMAQIIRKGGCNYNSFSFSLRYLILNQKVYLYDKNQNAADSGLKIKNLIEQTLKQYALPDMYFVLYNYDYIIAYQRQKRYNCRKLPLFMFNKNINSDLEQNKFLFPDYYVLENWEQQIQKIKNSSALYKWEDKIPKIYFRGAASGPLLQKKQLSQKTNIFTDFHRAAFTILSLQHPDLIDARLIEDHSRPLFNYVQKKVGENVSISSQPTSMQQHIKYRYLISADGYAAAWKRIPLILFSNSVLFKPVSPNIQWFYDKLVPDENYIALNANISDIFQKMNDLQKNSEKAKQIARNANIMAEKYLTSSALKKYMAETLRKYANLQKMQLTQQQKKTIQNGVDIQVILQNQILIEQKRFALIILLVMFLFFLFVLKNLWNLITNKEVTQKKQEVATSIIQSQKSNIEIQDQKTESKILN